MFIYVEAKIRLQCQPDIYILEYSNGKKANFLISDVVTRFLQSR